MKYEVPRPKVELIDPGEFETGDETEREPLMTDEQKRQADADWEAWNRRRR